MNRFQKSILWLWLAAMICFMLCFNRVEPNEVGIVRNHITRKVSIQPPGLYLSAPWIGVSTVPTNPLRVGVPTSGRGFSGKLIQFVPERADDFIAREGWPFLAGAIAIALLVSYISPGWSIPFWVIAVFVLQFFRDPARSGSTKPNAVLSPADGRIVVVEHTQDPYGNRDALKISVFMNVFNVHSNRSPVDGEVLSVKYFPGKFFNAALDKASLENERNAMVLRTPAGHIVTAVQVAGLVAKRILCYAKAGDVLSRGQRYGFIRFGSRVDVYLPPGSRPRVTIGDKVSATSTVLADLPGQVS